MPNISPRPPLATPVGRSPPAGRTAAELDRRRHWRRENDRKDFNRRNIEMVYLTRAKPVELLRRFSPARSQTGMLGRIFHFLLNKCLTPQRRCRNQGGTLDPEAKQVRKPTKVVRFAAASRPSGGWATGYSYAANGLFWAAPPKRAPASYLLFPFWIYLLRRRTNHQASASGKRAPSAVGYWIGKQTSGKVIGFSQYFADKYTTLDRYN